MKSYGLIVAVLGLALAGQAAADDAPGIAVAGHAEHPLRLGLPDLKALPQHAVDVTFESAHGQQSGHYGGALLWDVVQKAGIAEAPDSKAKHHLQHALLVTGRDGYTVAVAVGEIDPDFEGKTIILTDDGGPGGIRLIVPGDKHGGRDVRDVVRIEVQ